MSIEIGSVVPNMSNELTKYRLCGHPEDLDTTRDKVIEEEVKKELKNGKVVILIDDKFCEYSQLRLSKNPVEKLDGEYELTWLKDLKDNGVKVFTFLSTDLFVNFQVKL